MALQMDYTDKYGQPYVGCYWVVKNFHWERNEVNQLVCFATIRAYLNREVFHLGYDYILEERYDLDLKEDVIKNYDTLRTAIYEELKTRPEFEYAVDVIETPEVEEEVVEETPTDLENPIINP